MNVTDLIAFFAFVIALYSAVLSTYTAINEFFKLKLSYLGKSYITLSKSDVYVNDIGEQLSSYNKNLYTIAIFVRIENQSKNPTTINEFILNNKYLCNSSSKKPNSYLPTKFESKSNYLLQCSSIYLDNRFVQPLLTINGLSTCEGFLVFDNLESLPSHFDIKISAIQKSKTFHLKFPITADYRNAIKS